MIKLIRLIKKKCNKRKIGNKRPNNYKECQTAIPPKEIDAELNKLKLEINKLLLKHKKTCKQLDEADSQIRSVISLRKFYVADGLIKDD